MTACVKITECPRDAMQGIKKFIPTKDKIKYMNTLLKVGFDILDFGSFVSPKAVPQMQDTAEVVKSLQLEESSTQLLAIVGNLQGARQACQYEQIRYLGFPFSFSPTFLERNINSTVEASFERIQQLLSLCNQYQKALRIYISMAFGNPYGDPWSAEMLMQWIDQLHWIGIRQIVLADTTGIGQASTMGSVLETVIPAYGEVSFGLHLHTTSADWEEKVDSTFRAGCRHYDGVLNGLGGCPMAGPDLVGNIRTTDLLAYFSAQHADIGVNAETLQQAAIIAEEILP
jgi:hydroxymethylglutaryl-CoA lyase